MADDERETASSNDQHDSAETICEYCGSEIDTSDWYPVTKERESDGSLQFYSFCREDCRDAWSSERAE